MYIETLLILKEKRYKIANVSKTWPDEKKFVWFSESAPPN